MGGTFKLPFVIISSMACWNTIYGCHAWGLPRVADCFPIKNGGCDPIPAIGFCHQLSNIDARLLNPWCTLWRNSVVANKKEPEKDTWRNLVTPKVFWQQCSLFFTALQYINCVGMKSRFWKSNIQNPARVIICKNRSRIIDFISHSSLALRAMWPCLMPRAESFFPWYAHHCTRRAIFFDGCPKFPYQSCRFAEERIGGTLVCLACLWEFLSLVAEVNWRPCKFSLGFHPPVKMEWFPSTPIYDPHSSRFRYIYLNWPFFAGVCVCRKMVILEKGLIIESYPLRTTTVDGRIIQTLIHRQPPSPQISMLFSCLVRSFE